MISLLFFIITSTFGEYRWDHIHSGMDLVVKNNDKKGVEHLLDSSPVYSTKDLPDRFSFLRGGGNFLISRNKELLLFFMHLEKLPKSFKNIFDFIGNSGKSCGRHLHFAVYDRQKKIYVNPIGFLKDYVKDNKAPRIIDVYKFSKDGSLVKLSKRKINFFNEGDSLIIHTFDYIGKHKVGIYSLRIVKGNSTLFSLVFDCLSYDYKNKKCIRGMDYKKIYYKPHYFIVDGKVFPKGFYSIKIYSLDFSENKTVYELQINKF